MPVAGQVKIILAADAASYSAALDKAKKQLGQFAGSAAAAGTQSRQSMSEATGAVRVLGEEIGLRLPRHISTFIAKLPGVTAAMSSAFSAIAVLYIAKSVVDLGERVVAYKEKLQEAARKNQEAWRAISLGMNSTNDALRLTNDRLQASIAKLEGKPQNRLKEAIDEAVLSADQLAKKLDDDIEKISATLKPMHVGMGGNLAGQASISDIEKKWEDLRLRIAQTTIAGRDQIVGAGNDSAAVDRAQADMNQKLLALYKEGSSFASRVLDSAQYAQRAQQDFAAGGYNYPAAARSGFNSFDMTSRIQAATGLLDFLAQERDYLGLRSANIAGTAQQQSLEGAASTQAPAFSWGSDLSITHINPLARAQAAANRQSDTQDIALYGAQQRALELQEATAQFQKVTAEKATQLVALWKAPDVVLGPQHNALQAAIKDLGPAIDQLRQNFTDLSGMIAGQLIETVDKFNQTLMQILSTRASFMRGQHPWRQLGGSLAQSAGNKALQYGEGKLIDQIKAQFPGVAKWLNGKPDGSKGNPFFVKIADDASKAGSGIGSSAAGLSGLLSGGASGIGGIIGAGGAAAGGGGAASAGIGMAASAFAGFAVGGMIPSDVPVLVGERGPEVLMGAGGRSVIPNDALGGTIHNHNTYIDARGATDPAAVDAAARRGAAYGRQQAIADIANYNRRVPTQKRLR